MIATPSATSCRDDDDWAAAILLGCTGWPVYWILRGLSWDNLDTRRDPWRQGLLLMIYLWGLIRV